MPPRPHASGHGGHPNGNPGLQHPWYPLPGRVPASTIRESSNFSEGGSDFDFSNVASMTFSTESDPFASDFDSEDSPMPGGQGGRRPGHGPLRGGMHGAGGGRGGERGEGGAMVHLGAAGGRQVGHYGGGWRDGGMMPAGGRQIGHPYGASPYGNGPCHNIVERLTPEIICGDPSNNHGPGTFCEEKFRHTIVVVMHLLGYEGRPTERDIEMFLVPQHVQDQVARGIRRRLDPIGNFARRAGGGRPGGRGGR
ncbi:MAG: hypothetical protein Q9208_000364 [Pyrenodesmia sp. 3 TL-2023]